MNNNQSSEYTKNNDTQITPVYKRIISFIIDISLTYLTAVLILKVGIGMGLEEIFKPWGIGRIIIAFMFFTYFLAFIYFVPNQTCGCSVMRIRIVLNNGKKISLLAAFLKSIYLTLLAFPVVLGMLSIVMCLTLIVGTIVMLVSKNKECEGKTVWDAASGTKVVLIHSNTNGKD